MVRPRWHWGTVLALLFIANYDHLARADAGFYSGIVIRVVDGDTLHVRPDTGGRPHKIRMAGMDAPEICQSGGRSARDALARRVLHRRVNVATRANDDYGREVARVSLGGDDLALWMVTQGHAWSYRYRLDDGPYAAAQAQARQARRGLFAQPGAESPRDFRKRHGPCPRPVTALRPR
ncbi:MAG: thermonuclease family protein [Burkholderiales bacterium]|nr:thermonuclease family protein [Burkholderiales bacterium]